MYQVTNRAEYYDPSYHIIYLQHVWMNKGQWPCTLNMFRFVSITTLPEILWSVYIESKGWVKIVSRLFVARVYLTVVNTRRTDTGHPEMPS